MRNLIVLVFCVLGLGQLMSQDLNANVVVNAQLTGNENFPIYKTLQTQLNEFVNNTNWSGKEVLAQERINCNFVINVAENVSGAFKATLQVQSSRPIFNSSYTSSLYNVNDKDFAFNYTEFQQLIYNPNQYQSNLVSVIAYHINMVLGYDGDSFKLNGGDSYFKQAQTIVNYSQQENFKGWKLSDGLQSRFFLIDNLLSPAFSDLRRINYDYHRLGLDLMNENTAEAKKRIASALVKFESIAKKRPNSYVTRVFFDAKAEEIQQIFSDGPKVKMTKMLATLNRIAPMYATKWRSIQL